MSAAFLAPPGGVARLTEIVRHQGPVLELATRLRQCGSIQEIHRAWPSRNLVDDQSSIVVHRWPNIWMAAAQEVLCDPRWDASPNTARIICWSNRACQKASEQIRAARYGDNSRLWQVGEIVGNGDAIQRPGESLSPPLAPSSYEWRITSAEQIQLTKNFGTFVWFTPKRKDRREFEIGCDLPAQRLTLQPLDPDGRVSTIQVNVPLPGDDTWRMHLSELKKEIAKVDPSTRNKAWSAWHNLGSLCADIRSAAVLTVHRAQGSSFAHTWISNDLAFCSSADAVPLHYTALTRASKSVHIVERPADHYAVIAHQDLEARE
jgi:exodeoxyribonuclease-5